MRATLYPPSWMELPFLDDTRCTSCGLCPAVCPTDCLEMSGPLPWMPRPADCIACAACAQVCPAAAIEMASGAAR